MADKRMRLRAIVVSTRAALQSLPSGGDRIRTASDELLAELRADTIRAGDDPDLVQEIDAARRHLHDQGLAPARLRSRHVARAV